MAGDWQEIEVGRHFCHYWQEFADGRLTAMNTLALLSFASIAIFTLVLGWRLVSIVKADGYGFRSSSGLPRDWSPTPELPSTPYLVKPHV
jgi:hypothetical protein